MNILSNAETLRDIKQSMKYGAEGIGLCRTEHMFFNKKRIQIVRSMILSDTKNERLKYLNKLFIIQKNDFKKIFKIMLDKKIVIRYLDPPLHEFLPTEKSIINEINNLKLSNEDKINKQKNILKRIDSLKEVNPMLGHRGCRIGITYPEIYDMQTRSIFEAICETYNELKINFNLNLMIPFINDAKEFEIIKIDIQKCANKILNKYKLLNVIKYNIGAMIELPRSILVSNEIALISDFLSFGTNDLTQTTFGISRDDISKFISFYINKNIYNEDPFTTLDIKGVGELMKIGVYKSRSVKKDIQIGICGEHGGDPKSIVFADSLNLNYISCSPYRLPIAKLVSAQVKIKKDIEK